ncbi:MAG: hypothetical protein P4L71_19565 [Acetobacteraceae bacterium]|nr:hypothetical protein [Acetobacteraceae bacterium]
MRPTELRDCRVARNTRRIAVVLAGLAWSGAAAAAPFCLQNQGMTPQCIYYDAASCQHEAQRQNADCGINRNEVTIRGGTGQYCMVTSSLVTTCHYQDRDSCLADARRQNGACTDAPAVSPSRAPDPYSRQGY